MFLARMNLVGFHEAGKTSLAKRLMDKDFDANEKSTEGIALHSIKSTFDKDKLIGNYWKETDITKDDLDEEMIEQIKLNQGILKDPGDATENIEMVQEDRRRDDYVMSGETMDKRQTKAALSGATHQEKLTEIKMNARIKEKLASADMNNPPEKTLTQNTPFTLRLWDLGGQNDFLTTHHLFLDVEATTVIVMDITKDFNKKFVIGDKDLPLKRSNPTSPEEILHYWLNSFDEEVLEKEKKDGKPFFPNIFIVLTHIDVITPETRPDEIDSYTEKIMESLNGKDYASYVKRKNIFAVDNKTGDRQSFDELRRRLFQSFSKQGSWNKKIPTKWIQLQADITAEKEKANKYLTLTELKDMGANIGMGEKDIESFIQLHKHVGTFLHFDEDLKPIDESDSSLKLKDYIITDPQWLVDMCKEVITHPDFLHEKHFKQAVKDLKRGTVTEESLIKIWGKDATTFLTKLMLSYDIFIPIADAKETGQQYLIPCMLPLGSEDHKGRRSITILYSGVHRAGCGQWFQMGKFSKLLAALHRKKDWKISLNPFPSYDRVSFTRGKMHLQLTLEENPNFRAVMYCCTADIKDENLGDILRETRDFLYEEAQHIAIEN